MAKSTHLYPIVTISLIKNPTRWYAIPFIGGIAKGFMLIPVFLWLFCIGIAAFFISLLINPFYVLFTGKYWKVAYEINVLLITYSVKVSYFWAGLTNNYPFKKSNDVKITIDYPSKPNRFFAIPLFGGFARLMLLIPYFIYTSVIQYGAYIGALTASFVVLFKGYYPESFYEINRDQVRLSQAITMYMGGLKDNYPSWWISMNHKGVKIILIILGALWFLLGNWHSRSQQSYNQQYQPSYQNQQNYQPPTNNTY